MPAPAQGHCGKSAAPAARAHAAIGGQDGLRGTAGGPIVAAMLGFISITDDNLGMADAALCELAGRLTAQGVALAGTVQINTIPDPGRPCDMDLRILRDDGPAVRITQSLGPGASGCRLDTGALAAAAGRALAQLPDARLVIVNKFGKQEALGGGLRDVFAAAVSRGIPVITSVAPEYVRDFRSFAGDLAEQVDGDALDAWCRAALS